MFRQLKGRQGVNDFDITEEISGDTEDSKFMVRITICKVFYSVTQVTMPCTVIPKKILIHKFTNLLDTQTRYMQKHLFKCIIMTFCLK